MSYILRSVSPPQGPMHLRFPSIVVAFMSACAPYPIAPTPVYDDVSHLPWIRNATWNNVPEAVADAATDCREHMLASVKAIRRRGRFESAMTVIGGSVGIGAATTATILASTDSPKKTGTIVSAAIAAAAALVALAPTVGPTAATQRQDYSADEACGQTCGSWSSSTTTTRQISTR
jgi:hypothetical protein